MGKYRVSYDGEAKCIVMELSAHFSDEDAFNYVNEFIRISNKYKTDETYLTLDSGALHIYPCEIKEKLSAVFKLYSDIGYKLVRFKVYKAQKEMIRKVEELCSEFNLNYDIFLVDM